MIVNVPFSDFYHIPKSHTYTGIRDAVKEAALKGGGTVLLESVDYVSDGSGYIMIDSDNVSIIGQSGSKIIAPATGDINILQTWAPTGPSVTLTTPVTKFSGQVTLNSVVSFVKPFEKFIFITLTFAPNIQWMHVGRIASVDTAKNMVVFAPPLPFDIALNSTYTINAVKLLDGISIKNIRFDGNNNTTGMVRGLLFQYLTNVQLSNLTFENFNSSCVYIDLGFGNRVENITMTNSGDKNEGDFMCKAQTMAQVHDIQSINAKGFGPQFSNSNYCVVNSILSMRPYGRGIKLGACLYNQFVNMQTHEAYSTGLSIAWGSQYNLFTNCSVFNSRGIDANSYRVGLWFSDHHNINNQIQGCIFLNNASADIAIYPTDINNKIQTCQYGIIYNISPVSNVAKSL